MKTLPSQNLLRQLAVTLIALIAILAVADIALACPTCKDAVAANDPQHAGMVKGYFYSILFMMGMPFTLLGCFSLYMYNEVRKARARQVVDASQSSPSKQPRSSASAKAQSIAAVHNREPVEV